jgi:hypothetical protein
MLLYIFVEISGRTTDLHGLAAEAQHDEQKLAENMRTGYDSHLQAPSPVDYMGRYTASTPLRRRTMPICRWKVSKQREIDRG